MAVDGFLGRWSRRKLGDEKAKAGDAVPLPPLGKGADGSPRAAATAIGPAPTPSQGATPGLSLPNTEPGADQTPLPTLQDAQALTPESDFKPYLTHGVEPQVRNAAMKKLFADPRYNVMDRLDTYIDDYSQSDPIPESMLRRMASAQFLGLFEEKEEPVKETPVGDDADTPGVQSVAESEPQQLEPCAPPASQSGLPTPVAVATHATHHEDSDLRLQPDDAAPVQAAGRSAG
jgi:hypothetical protein